MTRARRGNSPAVAGGRRGGSTGCGGFIGTGSLGGVLSTGSFGGSWGGFSTGGFSTGGLSTGGFSTGGFLSWGGVGGFVGSSGGACRLPVLSSSFFLCVLVWSSFVP